MAFLDLKDTISGKEARAYLSIDGRNEELFYAKKLKAQVKKKKKSGNVLGHRGEQHKAAGWSGDGDMTLYYVTSLFRELMLKYMKTGVDTYFDLTVTNEDPTSTIGKQTIVLKNCNFDEINMAIFDVDNESLDEDIKFTFSDVDLLDKFNKPVLKD